MVRMPNEPNPAIMERPGREQTRRAIGPIGAAAIAREVYQQHLRAAPLDLANALVQAFHQDAHGLLVVVVGGAHHIAVGLVAESLDADDARRGSLPQREQPGFEHTRGQRRVALAAIVDLLPSPLAQKARQPVAAAFDAQMGIVEAVDERIEDSPRGAVRRSLAQAAPRLGGQLRRVHAPRGGQPVEIGVAAGKVGEQDVEIALPGRVVHLLEGVPDGEEYSRAQDCR